MDTTDKKRTNKTFITALLTVIAIIVVLLVIKNYGPNSPENQGAQIITPQTTVGTLNPGNAE